MAQARPRVVVFQNDREENASRRHQLVGRVTARLTADQYRVLLEERARAARDRASAPAAHAGGLAVAPAGVAPAGVAPAIDAAGTGSPC